MSKIKNIFTPQVRTFVYGAVAALLSVATVQGWVSDDLAKSINDNLPTIFGALASILAAANVKRATPAEPAVPVIPVVADRVDAIVEVKPVQAPAVELPLS